MEASNNWEVIYTKVIETNVDGSPLNDFQFHDAEHWKSLTLKGVCGRYCAQDQTIVNSSEMSMFDFSKYRYKVYFAERPSESVGIYENKIPAMGEHSFSISSPYLYNATVVIERQLKNSPPTISVTNNNPTLSEGKAQKNRLLDPL